MKAEDNKVSNIVLMSSESERDETVKAIGDVLAIGGSVGDHGQELKVFRKYWDAVKLLTYPDVLLLSTNPPYTTMAVAQSAHDLDRSVGRELETFALEILKCKNYLDSQGQSPNYMSLYSRWYIVRIANLKRKVCLWPGSSF